MKICCLLLVFSFLFFSCDSGDNVPMDQIEVVGQAAQIQVYNPYAYDPFQYNPFTKEMGGRGRLFTDFCVWFTVKNSSGYDLIFDGVEAVWFFGDGFFSSNMTLDKGERFIIAPDSSRQFSFTTANRVEELKDKYGDKFVNFCFTLVAIKNSQEEMREWKKNKNPTAEEIDKIKATMKIKSYGPFISENLPLLTSLPVGDEREANFGTDGQKYFPLKFF